MPSHSEVLADWFLPLPFAAIPADVVANTKLHILDTLGLALAAAGTEYGRVLRQGALRLGSGDEAHILGFGDRTSAATAVLVNGGLADAMDFDDTHNETHLHPSAHIVPAALTFGEMQGISGRELLTLVAAGNEVGCRLAVVAPGQFVKNGFHSSAIVGTVACTLVAARCLGLSHAQTVHAVGTAGSQAAGILECYDDGTWTQLVHPGWIGHAALAAAYLAEAGMRGPATVLEGRRGLYRSHIQDPSYPLDFERMLRDLGSHWENRFMSLKGYPTGCVIHPYLDAVLHLREAEGLRGEDVEEIVMPMSHHWAPLVCEPVARKIAPDEEFEARISLNWAVAEALHCGGVGLDAFSHDNLTNPAIRALAAKTRYVLDEDPPPRREFKGWVIVKTRDGRTLERIEHPWTKGHHGDPGTPALVQEKFKETAGRWLPPRQVDAIMACVDGLEDLPDVSELVRLCMRA